MTKVRGDEEFQVTKKPLLGSPWGVLGAALGGPWGAYRSLGGPGVPWSVHGGFLELIVFCFGEVSLLLLYRNIDILNLLSFFMNSDVLCVLLFSCFCLGMLFANQ